MRDLTSSKITSSKNHPTVPPYMRNHACRVVPGFASPCWSTLRIRVGYRLAVHHCTVHGQTNEAICCVTPHRIIIDRIHTALRLPLHASSQASGFSILQTHRGIIHALASLSRRRSFTHRRCLEGSSHNTSANEPRWIREKEYELAWRRRRAAPYAG